MKRGILTSALFVSILIGFVFAISSYGADDADRITPVQLKERLDSPDTVVLDARVEEDWKKSEFKIKGAFRADPSKFDDWADSYSKDASLVFY